VRGTVDLCVVVALGVGSTRVTEENGFGDAGPHERPGATRGCSSLREAESPQSCTMKHLAEALAKNYSQLNTARLLLPNYPPAPPVVCVSCKIEKKFKPRFQARGRKTANSLFTFRA
jgi:hypothetical protein